MQYKAWDLALAVGPESGDPREQLSAGHPEAGLRPGDPRSGLGRRTWSRGLGLAQVGTEG